MPRSSTTGWCRLRSIVVVVAIVVSTASTGCPRSSTRGTTIAIVSSALLPRGRCASRAALPRLEVAVLVTAIIASGAVVVSIGTGFEALLGLALAVDRGSSTKFAHERVVVIVSCISATDSGSSRSAVESTSVVVAPVRTALTIGTVTSHVACVTADTANDASSEVLCLRAVELAMSDLATVLASLVFVVTQGTVESGKFTELVALELVLAFGDRGSLNMS
jgi:hypothetical protein